MAALDKGELDRDDEEEQKQIPTERAQTKVAPSHGYFLLPLLVPNRADVDSRDFGVCGRWALITDLDKLSPDFAF